MIRKGSIRIMNKTIITSDSTCFIPPRLISDEVPLIQAEIKTESGLFRESYEISSENIIEYARQAGHAPQLICPSEEDYRRFFTKQLKKAPCICHLCCGLSRNSYLNAKKAAANLKNVFVADSMQIGGGMLFQIIQGVKLASEGFSPEFIIKSISELDSHINSTYVSRDTSCAGQLGLVSKKLASLLDFLEIAPTITIRNGGVISGAVFKNGHRYYEMYIKKMLKNKKNIDSSILVISCPTPFGNDIERFKKEVAKYVDFEQIVVTDVPARFACRLGEEALGLHFLNT